MNTKLIFTNGHSFLPLATRVKQSAHNDTHFVEVLIGGNVVADRVVQGITAARTAAAILMGRWDALLTPAFEAGRASCTCARAQRRIDAEERDLAHEADMRELRREQLLADVGDDVDAYMGDPDEWDDQ